MTISVAAGWALTAVFTAAALLYVGQAVRADGGQRRATWLLHALAALAMVAMIWPIGMTVSPVVYLLFFTGCGLFVVYTGLYGTNLHAWPYHAAMMAAMAAMTVTMDAAPSGSAAPAAMPMSGQQMSMPAGPAVTTTDPVWLRVSAAVLAVLLLAAALWWFYVLVRGPQRPYADLVMAIGMGTIFVLLV